eukprot:g34499.t1
MAASESYVPICLPAFSPANCHRADDGGQYAKTSTSMRRLKQLHEEQKHPFLYHCAQKAVWEKCKADNKTYYPPTYKQDGFTHATADGSKLLGVLNHFYKDVPGEWVCLKFTRKSLAIAGVDVVFEEPAPVGDTPAIDSGGQLFPHLMGGIPTATGVVLDELPILRAPGGGFQSIPGVTEPRESDSVGQSAPQHQRIWAGSVAASFWCGLAVGAALTAVDRLRKLRKLVTICSVAESSFIRLAFRSDEISGRGTSAERRDACVQFSFLTPESPLDFTVY